MIKNCFEISAWFLNRPKLSLEKKCYLKGSFTQNEHFFFSCLAYSPSSCSKHACVSFFCWTQKKIFINIPHITNWLHNRNEILGSYYLKKVFVNYIPLR